MPGPMTHLERRIMVAKGARLAATETESQVEFWKAMHRVYGTGCTLTTNPAGKLEVRGLTGNVIAEHANADTLAATLCPM